MNGLAGNSVNIFYFQLYVLTYVISDGLDTRDLSFGFWKYHGNHYGFLSFLSIFWHI